LNAVKTNGCITCHQLGNKATRTMPKELGHFNSSAEAWQRRIVSGQAMTTMVTRINEMGANKATGLFGDWTDRIAAGELPATKPMRPQGVERNIVVTLWDWSNPKAYLHDEISTDKRNPTLNANGLIFGATELSTDFVPVLDPVRHKATEIKHPVRDPKTPSAKTDPLTPSPYSGAEPIWDSQSNHHNPMLDEKARVFDPVLASHALEVALPALAVGRVAQHEIELTRGECIVSERGMPRATDDVVRGIAPALEQ